MIINGSLIGQDLSTVKYIDLNDKLDTHNNTYISLEEFKEVGKILEQAIQSKMVFIKLWDRIYLVESADGFLTSSSYQEFTISTIISNATIHPFTITIIFGNNQYEGNCQWYYYYYPYTSTITIASTEWELQDNDTYEYTTSFSYENTDNLIIDCENKDITINKIEINDKNQLVFTTNKLINDRIKIKILIIAKEVSEMIPIQ